jgi:hypothetical protein
VNHSKHISLENQAFSLKDNKVATCSSNVTDSQTVYQVCRTLKASPEFVNAPLPLLFSLRPSVRKVFKYLVTFASNSWIVDPSQERIASKTGIKSRSTVELALATLRDLGLLTWIKRGWLKRNFYLISGDVFLPSVTKTLKYIIPCLAFVFHMTQLYSKPAVYQVQNNNRSLLISYIKEDKYKRIFSNELVLTREGAAKDSGLELENYMKHMKSEQAKMDEVRPEKIATVEELNFAQDSMNMWMHENDKQARTLQNICVDRILYDLNKKEREEKIQRKPRSQKGEGVPHISPVYDCSVAELSRKKHERHLERMRAQNEQKSDWKSSNEAFEEEIKKMQEEWRAQKGKTDDEEQSTQ